MIIKKFGNNRINFLIFLTIFSLSTIKNLRGQNCYDFTNIKNIINLYESKSNDKLIDRSSDKMFYEIGISNEASNVITISESYFEFGFDMKEFTRKKSEKVTSFESYKYKNYLVLITCSANSEICKKFQNQLKRYDVTNLNFVKQNISYHPEVLTLYFDDNWQNVFYIEGYLK